MKNRVASISVALVALVLFVAVNAQQARYESGYLRSNRRYETSYIANESHDGSSELYHGRALGKSGKGVKGSYVDASTDRSSSECIKWETSYVTELKPQYYYWRPYSSKSSKSAESKTQYTTSQSKYYYYGKSGKGAKGRRGRALHDKVMMKYVEVQKEVKNCVEYKAHQNLFAVSGGKSGKAAGGKSGKSGSIAIHGVGSTDESLSNNSETISTTTATVTATGVRY